MLRAHERLRSLTHHAPWRPDGVHRLIATIEADGKATVKERASLREILARDRFVPRARRDAEHYLAFAERIARHERHEQRAPHERPVLGAIDVARYRRDVEVLSGERPTLVRGRSTRFRDRFSASPENQLDLVRAWLVARYRALGFEATLEPVYWRGQTLENVVVTIRGDSDEAVVVCDHYDVADKEPIKPASLRQLARDHGLSAEEIRTRRDRIRVGQAVPGADDDASGTAALLEMATLLRARLDQGVTLDRTIQLVHLVGEELPADCLGGRAHVARAQATGARIKGAIVLDMIGVDRTGTRRFQVSPGRGRASLLLAARVKETVSDLGLDVLPVLRPHGSRKSFLHQTDAIHFSRAGYPVVLINEAVNDDRDRYRVGYHDEFDVPRLMRFAYAAQVARAALETAYALAGPRPPRP